MRRSPLAPQRVVVIAPGSHTTRIGLASSAECIDVRSVVAWRSAQAPSSAAAPEAWAGPAVTEKDALAHVRALQTTLSEWRRNDALYPDDAIETALTTASAGTAAISLSDDGLQQPTPLPPAAQACVVGDEALRLSPLAPFALVWPFEQGFVRHSDARSPSLSLASVEALFRHAVSRLGIDGAALASYAVCLVVPTLHRRRDTVALVDVLLRQLGFAEAFVNCEAMCAAMGAGRDTACVIDIGHQRTTVACVYEGVVQPESRYQLPFGSQGVASALLRFLVADDEQLGNMFGARQLSAQRLRDVALVERLRDRLCHVDVRAPPSVVHRTIAIRALDFDSSGAALVREFALDRVLSDSFLLSALTLFVPGALNCSSPLPSAVALFADDWVSDDTYSQQWLRAVDNVEVVELRAGRVAPKGYVPRSNAAAASSALQQQQQKQVSGQVGEAGFIAVVVETATVSRPALFASSVLDKVSTLAVGSEASLSPNELAAFYCAGGRVQPAPDGAEPPLDNGKLVWTSSFHALFIAATEVAHVLGEVVSPSSVQKYMIELGGPVLIKTQVSSHQQKWRKDMSNARSRRDRSDTLEYELSLSVATAPKTPVKRGFASARSTSEADNGADNNGADNNADDDDTGPPPLQAIASPPPSAPSSSSKRRRTGDADASKATIDAAEEPDAAPVASILPLQTARAEAKLQATAAVPLDEAVLRSVLSLEWASISLRQQLMNNMVVVGGGAMIGGLQQLLEAKLISHPDVPAESVATVSYLNTHGTPLAATWRGAALMAWQPSARKMYVTRDEWRKYGTGVLRERAPFQW